MRKNWLLSLSALVGILLFTTSAFAKKWTFPKTGVEWDIPSSWSTKINPDFFMALSGDKAIEIDFFQFSNKAERDQRLDKIQKDLTSGFSDWKIVGDSKKGVQNGLQYKYIRATGHRTGTKDLFDMYFLMIHGADGRGVIAFRCSLPANLAAHKNEIINIIGSIRPKKH